MDEVNASRSRGPNYLPPPGPIATVLTERPEMLRQMLLEQLFTSGDGIAKAISDEAYYVQRGTARKATEKAVNKRIAELTECVVMLAQIGWR